MTAAAANRGLWLPGEQSERGEGRGKGGAAPAHHPHPLPPLGTKAPPHLTGSLPGDRGFDPLGLGTDAGRLKW